MATALTRPSRLRSSQRFSAFFRSFSCTFLLINTTLWCSIKAYRGFSVWSIWATVKTQTVDILRACSNNPHVKTRSRSCGRILLTSCVNKLLTWILSNHKQVLSHTFRYLKYCCVFWDVFVLWNVVALWPSGSSYFSDASSHSHSNAPHLISSQSEIPFLLQRYSSIAVEFCTKKSNILEGNQLICWLLKSQLASADLEMKLH